MDINPKKPLENKEKEFFKTPCGHKFHKECIVYWLKVKDKCPICRNDLPGYESCESEDY
jgi:hypothetical protein